jgi:GNAT superfamily N-acetyltransferase
VRFIDPFFFLTLLLTKSPSFRAELEMLQVLPSARGQGLARSLIAAIEALALSLNRTLITFSTTAGSDADRFVYPRLGYQVFGRLPAYGEVPDGSGRRVDGVYYYKDLTAHEEGGGGSGDRGQV